MSEYTEHELMTDTELCKVLRTSRVSLRRHLRDPANPIHSIRQVKGLKVRRWVRESVMEFIS